jgi:mycothiol synthase
VTTEFSACTLPLDASLTIRAARWEDLAAVARLTLEVCAAGGDATAAVTADGLASDWKYEGFSPEQDCHVVETGPGRLVGYAALFDLADHCDLSGDVYVHPSCSHLGVGAALLRALEFRAGVHIQLAAPDARVLIRVSAFANDAAFQSECVDQGYSPVRYHWRMGLDLIATPPCPLLPSGLELRPFVRDEHAQAVWQARNECFKDNWGSHLQSFVEFTYHTLDAPDYDPTLWAVIWDARESGRDSVAGFAINNYRLDVGWIRTLGVCPAWRRRGLGLALLHQSFGEFYRRGTTALGLAVDASNPTGATRLYQKAGMRIVSEFVTFEKELRPDQAASQHTAS